MSPKDSPQGRRWLLLSAGVLIALALSFVPVDRFLELGRAITHRGALEEVTREALEELPWVLRALGALGFAWGASRLLAPARAATPDRSTVARGGRRWAFLPLVAAAVLVIAIRVAVLQDGMISGDEWNNYFTAALFADGRLYDAPPPDPEFFRFVYFVTQGDHYFSIFPPLWPAALAIGMRLGAAPWVNLLLSLLGMALAMRWEPRRASWIGWLLVLSPMFVFAAASYFASPLVFVLVLAELWALRKLIESLRENRRTSAGWALASGALWAACFAAHYPTAAGAGLPPLLYALWIAARRGHARFALLGIASAAAGLGMLGAYHHALHGGPPWLLPAWLAEHSILQIQPGPGSIARGLAYTALHLLRLTAWTFPLLPLLAWLGMRQRRDEDVLLWLSMAGLVAFYFFYASAGGPQFGPRYYFGLLGPLVLFASRALDSMGSSRGGAVFRVVLFGVAVGAMLFRTSTEHRRAASINAPFRLAREAHLQDAIVFLRNVNRSASGRNLPGWNGPVLFVQDLGGRDGELLRRYPTRQGYRFRNSPAGGALTPLEESLGAAPDSAGSP